MARKRDRLAVQKAREAPKPHLFSASFDPQKAADGQHGPPAAF